MTFSDHFDTSIVTLGGARPHMAVRGEGTDIYIVAGSKTFVRDPRLSPLAERPTPRRYQPMVFSLPPDTKWCCHCGEVRPRSYFSADTRTFDKLHIWCKACRNEHARKMYAAVKGGDVRPYTRREAVIELVSA